MYLTTVGGQNELHENIGNGQFRLLTTSPLANSRFSTNALAVADLDNDGDVCRHLLHDACILRRPRTYALEHHAKQSSGC